MRPYMVERAGSFVNTRVIVMGKGERGHSENLA